MDCQIKYSLLDTVLKEQKNHKNLITAVKINNVLRDVQTQVTPENKVEFIDMTTEDGVQAYQRSILFIMMAAVNMLYPDKEVVVEHSVNNGIYCELLPKGDLTLEMVGKIQEKMFEFVSKAKDIKKCILPREDAVALFRESQQIAKSKLLESLKQDYVSLYYCAGYYDYLYGPMLYNTSLLDKFAIDFYEPGLIVRTPLISNPNVIPPKMKQKKLSMILSEADRWSYILKCNYVTNLNEYIHSNKISELIRISEALHEKKIAQIADHIVESIEDLRLILIAGPSSSGKTTFAKRLGVELRLNGLKPVTISVDNYFVERVDNPKDENGDYDFECLEAIDLELFNNHIKTLLDGGTIEVPTFDFKVGTKRYNGEKMHLADDEILVIEGIHCLNDKLTSSIPMEQKYKIYISDLTVLNIDYCNRISTTDTRLIRRIVRDNNFRGYSALHTLRTWASVNRGENKNIFPYQENCDVMFNSSLIYELSVLKKQALPLLQEITNAEPEYAEAKRLVEFLKYFEEVDEGLIPQNSLLREFVGGSIFGD